MNLTLWVLLFVGSVCLFLVVVFYLFMMLLSMNYESHEKLSPFECGFSSLGVVSVPFSIHFFVMMLMFVIFDLEVVMFLSVVVSGVDSLFGYLVLLGFVLLGFYIEWWYGNLVWVV